MKERITDKYSCHQFSIFLWAFCFAGLLISVFPFIKAWFNVHHILPNIGNFRVHPSATIPGPEQPSDTIRREDPNSSCQDQRGNGEMSYKTAERIPSTDVPDILGRRKPKLAEMDLP
ncbi:Kinocilin [Bagarius yarrelli]|uniref:Kinocilin n=1 Tax=Bagarius yarrelli TaxID=175774 RepID=A0A556V3M0_BAGYA|nr:Kinocilin [Bagarius yarrelli]